MQAHSEALTRSSTNKGRLIVVAVVLGLFLATSSYDAKAYTAGTIAGACLGGPGSADTNGDGLVEWSDVATHLTPGR